MFFFFCFFFFFVFFFFWFELRLRLNSDDGMEKLKTYKLIKQKFELEPYLEVLTDRKQRKALTAFRISAHKLQIERGRHFWGKKKYRICTTYNVIEDEINFFCDCKKHSTLRNKMFQNIINYNINRSFSNRELFIDLMTNTDNTVLKSIGLFVSESNIS